MQRGQAPLRNVVRTPTLIAVTLALCLALAERASAQPLSAPPPVFSSVDRNGVDLTTGNFTLTSTDLTIGQPGFGGLTYIRSFYNTGWRDNYVGTLQQSGSTYTVSIGGSSETFTEDLSGNFTSNQVRGATLVFSGGLYTYTSAFGAVAIFDPAYASEADFEANEGRITSLTAPNGERLTFHYKTVTVESVTGIRLQSVTNNLGYQLHFGYNLDNPTLASQLIAWRTLTLVTAINNAVDYCNPTADSCGLSGWPTVAYSRSGNHETVVDSENRQTRFTYSGSNIVAIRRPSSNSSDHLTISYSNGRVSSVSNGTATWSYGYSSSGGILTTTITDPLSHSRVVTSQNGLVLTDRNGVSQTITFAYDTSGRLDRITLPEGNYVQYAYDARGNITQTTLVPKSGSGLSNITNSATYPSSCITPVVLVATCNLPISTTDERGFVTDYTYDTAHGGLLTVTSPDPDGGGTLPRPQARFEYTSLYAYYKNSGGSIVQAPSPVVLLTETASCATSAWSGSACGGGNADETVTTIDYGTTGVANNRLPLSVSIAAGDGSLSTAIATTWDNIGNLLTIDGPLSGTTDTTRHRYDLVRQLVGIVGPDPDAGGLLEHRATRYTYNLDGQVTSVELGSVDSQSDTDWAAFSQLAQVTTQYDFIGRATRRSLLTSSTTRAVVQTSYDNANRLDCTATRMNSAVFASLPSSACALSTEGTNGPDRITRITYDNADRPTRATRGYGTTNAVDEWTATYSSNGMTATLADASSNLTTFVYDGFDRLSRVRFPNTTGGGSSTSDYEEYTYNAASRVTLTRRRDTTTLTTAYDNLGRVTGVTPSSNGAAISYAYDNFGRTLSAATSSQTLEFAYDQLSRNVSQESPLGIVSYQYDLASRRTRITWPGSPTFYAQYDYNTAGDLTVIRENGATTGPGVLASYAYDNLGRRTSVTRGNDVVTTYEYDTSLRLEEIAHNLVGTAQDQTLNFTYNTADQIVARTSSNTSYNAPSPTPATTTYADNGLNQYTSVGGTTQNHDSRGNLTTGSFNYDIFNRLISGPNSAVLTYDPLGRLYQSQSASVAAARYLYDGPVIIAEYDGSNALQRRFVHGPGIDEPIVWYEGTSTTDRRWLAADHLGSVIAIINGSGTATTINTYDEYGVPGSSNNGRFQYTGQVWLPEIARYHYKTRAYSPALGRFQQTDPTFIAGGMNVYAYVGNDPLNFVDPFGLQEEEVVVTGCGYACQQERQRQEMLDYLRDYLGQPRPDTTAPGNVVVPVTVITEEEAQRQEQEERCQRLAARLNDLRATLAGAQAAQENAMFNLSIVGGMWGAGAAFDEHGIGRTPRATFGAGLVHGGVSGSYASRVGELVSSLQGDIRETQGLMSGHGC